MVATLVKASVLVPIGVLLVIGERRSRQHDSLHGISKISEAQFLQPGSGMMLLRQEADNRTEVVTTTRRLPMYSTGASKVCKTNCLEEWIQTADSNAVYKQKCEDCVSPLLHSAGTLVRAWKAALGPGTTGLGAAYSSVLRLLGFGDDGDAGVGQTLSKLAAGTWSGNMMALLHEYLGDTDELQLIVNLPLLLEEQGFNTGGCSKDEVVAIRNLESKQPMKDNLQKLKDLWYARQGYLKSAIIEMKEWVSIKTGKKVAIFPTGSSKLTSDKDVQIAMFLCGGDNDDDDDDDDKALLDQGRVIKKKAFGWDDKKIQTLADVVIWIRSVSSNIVALQENSPDNDAVLEKLYDINFYPPTLFNNLPRSPDCPEARQLRAATKKNKFYDQARAPDDTIAFHVRLDLQQPNQIRDFLNTEGERAMLKFDVIKTNKYLKNWKTQAAPALHRLLEAVQNNESPELNGSAWTAEMLTMTKSNDIGPEMYLTISSVLYVAWKMQMGHDIDADVLPIFGIVTALENLVHYRATGKLKYLSRHCHPYMAYLRKRDSTWQHFKKTFGHIKEKMNASAEPFNEIAVDLVVNKGLEHLMLISEELCNPKKMSQTIDGMGLD